jgi:hypothetical protein
MFRPRFKVPYKLCATSLIRRTSQQEDFQKFAKGSARDSIWLDQILTEFANTYPRPMERRVLGGRGRQRRHQQQIATHEHELARDLIKSLRDADLIFGCLLVAI